MNQHLMNKEAISKFAQSLRGSLIDRDHPEYEEARKLYNAMIDKRPQLIARCTDGEFSWYCQPANGAPSYSTMTL